MVFRGHLDGTAAAASLKDASVSLAVGEGYVVAWDLGARLYSVFRGGHTYRRGLSGRVLHKWRDPEAAPDAESPYDERQRVVAGQEEADRLIDESAALAARAATAIAAEPGLWRDETGTSAAAGAEVDPDGAPGAGGRLLRALALCARFDASAARADAARFAEVYSPIGILPPDQYMSIVIQATSGCSFGTCTFCDLYRDAYRVKTVEEFARHVAEVRSYLGGSLALRARSIFLGAANALAVPMPRLAGLIDVLHESFGGAAPPLHAFVDGFTGALKDASSYRLLAGRGLRRVYIGLESGHDPLLAFVRKPGTRAQAVETVLAVRSAGVGVGVILMIGLGGRRFAAGHVRDTIDAVNAMGLGAGDLLYFSDLVEVPGTSYPAIAASARVEALSPAERMEQLRAIRAGLRFAGPAPKFARYDVREFVY
jgi:hypothetical protein